MTGQQLTKCLGRPARRPRAVDLGWEVSEKRIFRITGVHDGMANREVLRREPILVGREEAGSIIEFDADAAPSG